MDVRYLNPFINAVKLVFKTMMETELILSKPCVKTEAHRASDDTAFIRFSGGATGSVALCFSKKTAIAIAEKFAGTEISADDTATLADALGELASMVAGQAKANVPTNDIDISLPEVVLGEAQPALGRHNSPVIVLPCDCEMGRFSLEVTMEVRKSSSSASTGTPHTGGVA